LQMCPMWRGIRTFRDYTRDHNKNKLNHNNDCNYDYLHSETCGELLNMKEQLQFYCWVNWIHIVAGRD
jgi:hypothetical protein